MVGYDRSGRMSWSGAVDEASALEYRQEGMENEDTVIVPPFDGREAAVAGAAAWAMANDLQPDAETLRGIFGQPPWTKPLHMRWPDLLRALGFRMAGQ